MGDFQKNLIISCRTPRGDRRLALLCVPLGMTARAGFHCTGTCHRCWLARGWHSAQVGMSQPGRPPPRLPCSMPPGTSARTPTVNYWTAFQIGSTSEDRRARLRPTHHASKGYPKWRRVPANCCQTPGHWEHWAQHAQNKGRRSSVVRPQPGDVQRPASGRGSAARGLHLSGWAYRCML